MDNATSLEDIQNCNRGGNPKGVSKVSKCTVENVLESIIKTKIMT